MYTRIFVHYPIRVGAAASNGGPSTAAAADAKAYDDDDESAPPAPALQRVKSQTRTHTLKLHTQVVRERMESEAAVHHSEKASLNQQVCGFACTHVNVRGLCLHVGLCVRVRLYVRIIVLSMYTIKCLFVHTCLRLFICARVSRACMSGR